MTLPLQFIFKGKAYPTTPAVPTDAPDGYLAPKQLEPTKNDPPFGSGELEALRGRIIELILQKVVLAVKGIFLPGDGSGFDQLVEWASDIPVLSNIVQAITGVIGNLTDLDTWFSNLRGSLFDGIDFLDGGFDGPTAISNLIDNLTPSGKLAELVGGKLKAGQEPQKLLDILTGTDVDASKIANLANIGDIAQSKITGLVAKLTNLDTSGVYDSSTLGNVTNIPHINIGRIRDNASDTVQDFFNGLFGAFTGADGSGTTGADNNSQMSDFVNTVATLSVAVNALQSDQTGSGNSGISGGDLFERTDNDDLGTDWSVTYDSGTSSNGFIAITNGHQAAWELAGSAAREGMARRTASADAVTDTDYQKIIATIGTKTSSGVFTSAKKVFTRFYCRMNSAATQYVFAEISSILGGTALAQFGYRNGGSDTYVGSAVATNLTGSMVGSNFELQAGDDPGNNDRSFRLYRNGALVTSWDDSGTTLSALGASNRGWGLGMRADTNGSTQAYYPWSVAAITIADNATPALVGSGGLMVRTSTGNVDTSSGANLLASSFFGSATATNDITADTTNNKFTVANEGWYQCDLAFLINTMSSNDAIAPVLYKNGSVYKTGHDLYRVDITGGQTPRFAQTSFGVYLAAGDNVQAGYNSRNSRTSMLTGEATGTQSYFSIALANPL